MNKPKPNSDSAIDRLLHDRAQFVNWLTRLNMGSDGNANAPEAVRDRVRVDYERRLEAVVEELRGHTAALEEQVDGLTARAGELESRAAQHKEQLAEAEVRHAVGEYDEGKWEAIRGELLKVIGQIHDGLSQTTAEIDRLNEVLDSIRTPVLEVEPEPPPPPPPPPPRPVAAPTPPRTPAVQPAALEPARPAAQQAQPQAPPAGTTEIPFRTPTPKPQAKPAAAAPAKKDDQPGRTLWFPSGKPEGGGKLDELAFLKSVTGHEAPQAAPAAPVPPPSPTRTAARPALDPKAAAPAPAPAPAPVAAPVPVPEPAPAKAAAAEPKDRSSSGQKTLKCAECGTLNRPTEWYCERCGSELAAL
jgi:hypothetical protein